MVPERRRAQISAGEAGQWGDNWSRESWRRTSGHARRAGGSEALALLQLGETSEGEEQLRPQHELFGGRLRWGREELDEGEGKRQQRGRLALEALFFENIGGL